MSDSPAYGVLTPAQLEGRACIVCDGQEGPMVPVTGMSSDRSAQLFEHERCRRRRQLVRSARVVEVRSLAGLIGRAQVLLEQATLDGKIDQDWHDRVRAWLEDAPAAIMSEVPDVAGAVEPAERPRPRRTRTYASGEKAPVSGIYATDDIRRAGEQYTAGGRQVALTRGERFPPSPFQWSLVLQAGHVT